MFPLRDENPHAGYKPKVTIGLIIVNVAVFLFEVATTGQFWEFSNAAAAVMFFEWGAVPHCVTGGEIIEAYGGRMPCPANPHLTLLTSTFMHGGLMHLGGNMLFLWIFGDNIEHRFGRAKFLGIYLAWGVGAGLAHIAIDAGSVIPAVGASGSISGILGAYMALFPRSRVTTFVMFGFFWRMMHIEARWFLLFWLVMQNILPFFIGGFGVAGGGTAFMAHLGGFAIGYGTGYLYKKMYGASKPTYGTRYGWRGDDWR